MTAALGNFVTDDTAINDQLEVIKAGQFASNVNSVFGQFYRGRADFRIKRIAEVVRIDRQFDDELRRAIADTREWCDQIEAAIGAPYQGLRRIK
ncbi:hypothetical protein [Nakamurella multipartita]|uniref:Uncharacterized protein n=1 Tax=Nakamurella multipartita (strain ATCC 700099 / DSM 44233 / CIP 104796 / JCM 9543 / NBRC 105858 / Y-104) TaxID=479431 RepID=C8X9R8_NAKMY|nr:hypothetical protein [Nakamurella multipartita]ACV79226.1 hypothetical protein Namu_2886 [Nakamurella multipartita DSM 44233]